MVKLIEPIKPVTTIGNFLGESYIISDILYESVGGPYKYEMATTGEVQKKLGLLLSGLTKTNTSREGHESHIPELEEEEDRIAGCSLDVGYGNQSNSV